jgi:hypothetical protein
VFRDGRAQHERRRKRSDGLQAPDPIEIDTMNTCESCRTLADSPRRAKKRAIPIEAKIVTWERYGAFSCGYDVGMTRIGRHCKARRRTSTRLMPPWSAIAGNDSRAAFGGGDAAVGETE